MIKNILKHFILITRHKILVFKLCVKAGIPFRGFMHDWSKYSITEFWESVKFYTGKGSPIGGAKRSKGYSEAWMHHRGRNKHHYEYWYDPEAPNPTPIIPYKYTVEMVCDRIAASIIYKGKDFENSEPLEYLEKSNKQFMNSKIEEFLRKVFTEVSQNGIDETIKPDKLKKWYNDIVK